MLPLRFSKGCTLTLDGVQHDAGRDALCAVCVLDGLIDGLHVMTVNLLRVQAEALRLPGDVAVVKNIHRLAVQLIAVVVDDKDNVVQLVGIGKVESLPDLALIGLAIADDAEYMVLAAVDAVAQCCAGGSGHTLAQRAGSEVDTGGQLAVGVAGELGMRLVKGIGLSHGISEDGVGAVVRGLVLDGIVAGVGAVLGFVPQMLVLFLMLAFLEACGYMARIAFVLDRVFRKFGLSGKSFIPMLIGTGCGIPGIMASRTIENERDRRMTIMTTTFIPCGAKVPFIAMIAGAVFGGSAWVATSAYFIGMLAIITSGIMLKKTKMFAGDPAPFVMELPAYHLPTLKNVLRSMWERGWSFIKKAGTIILLSTILVWFTTYFGFTSDGFRMLSEEEPDQSILAAIGAIRREMNNAKWTWFAIAYQCGFAYAISLMINQFGGLFTGNVNIIGVIAAVIVLGFMIWMLVRPYKESTKLTKEIKVS